MAASHVRRSRLSPLVSTLSSPSKSDDCCARVGGGQDPVGVATPVDDVSREVAHLVWLEDSVEVGSHWDVVVAVEGGELSVRGPGDVLGQPPVVASCECMEH